MGAPCCAREEGLLLRYCRVHGRYSSDRGGGGSEMPEMREMQPQGGRGGGEGGGLFRGVESLVIIADGEA